MIGFVDAAIALAAASLAVVAVDRALGYLHDSRRREIEPGGDPPTPDDDRVVATSSLEARPLQMAQRERNRITVTFTIEEQADDSIVIETGERTYVYMGPASDAGLAAAAEAVGKYAIEKLREHRRRTDA